MEQALGLAIDSAAPSEVMLLLTLSICALVARLPPLRKAAPA